jgi:hypothetical protein
MKKYKTIQVASGGEGDYYLFDFSNSKEIILYGSSMFKIINQLNLDGYCLIEYDRSKLQCTLTKELV